MFPIKYIDNNLVWNKDNEVFAYYELIPYNYSFLSAEQKFIVGILVSPTQMYHAGDPIGYADLSSSYWQQHLIGAGRVKQ